MGWNARSLVHPGSFALLVGLIVGFAGAAGVSVADPPAPTLIELDACAAPTPIPPPSAHLAPGETEVFFRVPGVVHLQLRSGVPSAAATNTGCAPRAGDQFVVLDRIATSGEAAAAIATFRSGDWRTPGVWHQAG